MSQLDPDSVPDRASESDQSDRRPRVSARALSFGVGVAGVEPRDRECVVDPGAGRSGLCCRVDGKTAAPPLGPAFPTPFGNSPRSTLGLRKA